MNKLYLSVLMLFISATAAFGQVAINTGGSQPDASAQLDINSTVKGVLLPRLTTSQRNGINSPANSLMLYDNSANKYFFYTNSSWVQFYTSQMSIDDLFDAASDGKSIFFGTDAGKNDDGYNYNTAVGKEALMNNVSGSYNNAFGFQSLYHCINGSNTAIGYKALYSNTSGSYNMAIGENAGYYNQEGIHNTFIGFEAGKGTSPQNISGNVFIGYKAGYNETGDNKLYIANSETTSPLIYGDFGSGLLRINGTLNINGAYSLPLSDGNPGQLLVTDGAGTLSWTNGPTEEIDDLSDGKTPGNSLFLGEESGSSNSGNDNKNTGIGYQVLKDNISGIENTGIGYQALYQIVSKTGNTAAGFLSIGNSSGEKNTAVGIATLLGTDADSNCAVGAYALQFNDTGKFNTGIGRMALYNNTTGNNNTAIGCYAGYGNQEGSENTFIGAWNPKPTSTYNISGSVFIGFNAGYNERNSNRLYIDNSSTSSPLIYGEFDNDFLRIGGTLQIKNSYTFPSSDGTNGQILETDGTGTVTWSDNNQSINSLKNGKTTSSSSIFLGWDAGKNEAATIGRNIAIGDSALMRMVEGSDNIAMGYHSLKNLVNTSTGHLKNIAIGYETLDTLGSGAQSNIAIGYRCLKSCINGSGSSSAKNNIAIGHYNLPEIEVSGGDNIAIGKFSMENASVVTSKHNIGFGYFSLYELSSGDYNIGIGYNALNDNTEGAGNTAIGKGALEDNTTGNYNTAIGYTAKPNTADLVYTGSFGYMATPLAGGRIKFGDNLHVNWIGGNSAWHNTSDGRFKKKVKENVPGIDFIMKLRPVTFRLDNYSLEKYTGTPDSILNRQDNAGRMLAEKNMETVHTGFIAQEVEKAARETGFDFDAVSIPQNQHDVYSLAYAEFVVPLVKAVQEQHLKIENQKEVLLNQAKHLEALQQKILNNAQIIEDLITK